MEKKIAGMVIIPAFFALILLVSSQAYAATFPKLEWVRTYDSPASNHDMGWGVALDVVGNPFVVGRELRPDLGQDYNIWLRKYDTNGNTLWTETYDNPAHEKDSGYGVAVDAAGNVCVIGHERRDGLGQAANIWLRKYDTDGNTLWTQTYDSPSHLNDSGRGVVIDESGNVYAIGIEERDDLGQDFNIWLGKYDSNGNLLWARTYDGPAHGEDICWGGAIDSSGNIYVTGHEQRDDVGQGHNIWLRKYAPDGDTIWTNTYDSVAHSDDTSYDVALDHTGNAYVVGAEMRSDLGEGLNILLLKYDTVGNLEWTQTHNGAANGEDMGWGVTVDSLGYVYVTGWEYRDDLGQSRNIWIRKYDSDGNTLWTETYDGSAHESDKGKGVAVDSLGNVYVAGVTDGDIILLKYSQVPEPSTFILLLAPGVLGFAGVVLKRRK